MILDLQTRLSSAQAFTATAATTNHYDSGGAFNLDRGEPMAMVINVGVAADFTTGDETYSFAVQTDSATGFGTVQTLVTQAILAAALTAGSQHVIPLPSGCLQFVRGLATLAGTTPSVTCDIDILPLSMAHDDATIHYASGSAIS